MRSRALWAYVLGCFAARLDGATQMEWLPGGRPFRLTLADPREVRMAIGLQGDGRIQAAIGNYFSLLALKPESRA